VCQATLSTILTALRLLEWACCVLWGITALLASLSPRPVPSACSLTVQGSHSAVNVSPARLGTTASLATLHCTPALLALTVPQGRRGQRTAHLRLTTQTREGQVQQSACHAQLATYALSLALASTNATPAQLGPTAPPALPQ
jgi:hypothetical protein